MKQAYLITAYKDFDQLYELAKFFSKTAYVFIHVDEKSKSITDRDLERLNIIPGCEAFRSYKIAWGSFHHVEAIVELMIRALLKEDVSYLHLLTGEDFPLLSAKQLDERFSEEDHIYMDYIEPGDLPKEVIVRYRYKNIMANRNVKNKLLWQIQNLSGKLQEKKGRIRKGIGVFGRDRIYKGLVYCSMPREAGAYAIGFISGEGAGFWEDLKTCQVPEEFFFQSIFMNSDIWREKVVNRQLRYMDWSKGDGASPVYLDASDYQAVAQARKDGYCFARKFHPERSKKLRDRLRREFLTDIDLDMNKL